MSLPGLLCVLLATPAEPPGPALGRPALTRGDRIPFAGEITDEVDAAGRATRRAYELDVSLFVLDVTDTYSDCAVFTKLTPKSDPGVVTAAAHVLGSNPGDRAATPTVRLDRVRIDLRGRVARLAPPGRPPPFKPDPAAAGGPIEPVPLDAPPVTELGMLVPVPAAPAAAGATWTVPDGDRPDRHYTARGTEFRHGAQCLRVEAVQQSAGWADLAKVAAAWQRTDTLTVSPADGLARAVVRAIVHREGNTPVRTITVRYDMRPAIPHAGKSYLDVRAEIETAAWLGAELDKALVGKADPAAVERVRERAKEFEADRPATAFRPAVEAVRLRAEAALAGRALGER